MKIRTFTRDEIEQVGFECRNKIIDDYILFNFVMEWEGLESLEDPDEWDDWTDWGSESLNREIECIFRCYESRMNYFRDNGFFDEL